MEIKTLKEPETVDIVKLNPGNLFKYKGEYYTRVMFDDNISKVTASQSLGLKIDGRLERFCDNCKVVPVWGYFQETIDILGV